MCCFCHFCVRLVASPTRSASRQNIVYHSFTTVSRWLCCRSCICRRERLHLASPQSERERERSPGPSRHSDVHLFCCRPQATESFHHSVIDFRSPPSFFITAVPKAIVHANVLLLVIFLDWNDNYFLFTVIGMINW